MCILFLELREKPLPGGYRLILASNRDEQYRRPTTDAHSWQEAPSVIGGRDMEPGREGGTWLALDTAGHGRLAVLLNVMGGPSLPTSLPRGELVANFVRGKEHGRDYLQRVATRGLEHSAFHLLTIELDPEASGLWHYSNCSPEDGVDSEVLHFKSGRLALGNSLIQEPFKKVTAGEQRFSDILNEMGDRAEKRDLLVQELVSLLKWNHEHLPDSNLERRSAKANLSEENCRMSSSIFQRHPTYGTRTHTIILVDDNWRCDFYEWTLAGSMEGPVDPDTSPWNASHETFQLGSSSSG